MVLLKWQTDTLHIYLQQHLSTLALILYHDLFRTLSVGASLIVSATIGHGKLLLEKKGKN